MAIINLIGALGPELAFDALWYHLTLPKLFLLNHSIYHIPGGLLYYSDMPKLGELLYIGAMAFGDEITAKVLHWFFGVLVSLCIYKVSRLFFNQLISIVAALFFYSSLVVAWESTTAYIDLIRTFFEVLALWAFLIWRKVLELKWFVLSAIMTGLAIATKLLAVGTIIVFILLTVSHFVFQKKQYKRSVTYSLAFMSISVLIPMPWFLFSFINTGNPFYPLFSDVFAGLHTKVLDISLLSPFMVISSIWNVFTYANDPLSPLYIIFLPLLILYFNRSQVGVKIIYSYFVLALGFWYTTSQVEGSRLLVPYLPALSILCAGVLTYVRYRKFLLYFIIFIVITTGVYRFGANMKFIPVILGQQTKSSFLEHNLNFGFGDFYDIDGYFAKTIKTDDVVLLYGFHNLYYIQFPYIHRSWVTSGDTFNYIAVQDAKLPDQFKNWKMIYENKKTNVKLYSDGGNVWRY